MATAREYGALTATAPTRALQGTGYRSIDVNYQAEPLSVTGSLQRGGRFNAKGEFGAIYLAGDPVTALAEIEGLLMTSGGLIGLPQNPRTMFSIHYDLARVLDLTDAVIVGHLGVTSEALKGPWRVTENPVTHLIGRAAYHARIQAIRFPSTKHPQGINLAVFPANFAKGGHGYLRVHDSSGRFLHAIP